MSHSASAGSVDTLTSVRFVPLPKSATATGFPALRFDGIPLVKQIVDELHQPLTELVERIQRAGAGKGAVTVLVTGCGSGVGCTTVALALGAVATAAGKVLLVDADFSSPGLARTMGLDPARGWDELVREPGMIDAAVKQSDNAEHLDVLPLKPAPGPGMGVKRPSGIPELLDRFRGDYSVIVLDAGSVWESGSYSASFVDVALVVCDTERAAADEWAHAWDRLEEAGSHVMGIVETFT